MHSLYRPGTYLTGDVWDGYLTYRSRRSTSRRARLAILGNAAGTTARAYGHYFPETEIDGVEIDGELTEIGERFFDLDNPNLTTHHEDARPWLRRSEGGLRRDHGRRLPPALHPLLPRDRASSSSWFATGSSPGESLS